ncbi:MAG TPA: carboxylesterase/lipase family protein [Gammaproteobacteria bacterium]|nr:carboxylesterase/lipase family protein [Gammaproteobacteria bacterium]
MYVRGPFRSHPVVGLLVGLLAMLFTTTAGAASWGSWWSGGGGTSEPLLVTTSYGKLQGKTDQAGGMREFLGIPYAAPPVGRLRWRPPRSPAPWSGVRDATQFAPHCAQAPSFFGRASSTENCLYLNVFTPTDPSPRARGYPVMVWIHGGGLTSGESNDYIPTALVRQGVIVVTINYRLGLFGFLAEPALDSENHPSVNYGFMDQQAALRWVQQNIADFDGQPHNVTIFGESAGGLSVLAQMTSPGASGLFDKAIVQSGSYGSIVPSLSAAEQQGKTFASSVGCDKATPARTAACLRALPVSTVLGHQPALVEPAVDGTILPRQIEQSFLTGQFHRVPFLQGTNHDEMRLFVAAEFDLNPAQGPVQADQYQSVVASLIGPDVAPQVVRKYPLSNYPSPDLAVASLWTDYAFACPASALDLGAGLYTPTYAYEFNDRNAPELFLPPVSFPYGAAHASELQYLFTLPQSRPLSSGQQQLSRDMVRYWTNFARHGNPNGRDTPYWAPDIAGSVLQSLVPPSPRAEYGLSFAADHKCLFWTGIALQTGALTGGGGSIPGAGGS